MDITYVFSAQENLFFAIKYKEAYDARGAWPADAQEVPDSVFNEFACEAPPFDKVRAAGADGLPLWVDAPAPTNAELIELAESVKSSSMRVATVAIAPLQDAVDLEEATASEQEQLAAWKHYRVALNRIEQQSGYPKNVIWPQKP